MKPLTFLPFALLATAEYIWPSPYDEIEDILYLQTGYLSRNFVAGVTPCSFGGNIPGRQFAAEWIRTAFHDTITHNTINGTGGLDGSIWYELDRAENAGAAFNNTFSFFANLYSIKASASDLLALSVVVANAGCGGVKMDFRAGRKDALQSGPAGVPETFMSLKSTRGIFGKAGFSDGEMITLIACGHTLGGIHGANNPDLTNATLSPFDSSPTVLDSRIVSEYLDGTTGNLLVVGRNVSLRSDKRIFESDGNVTMRALATQDFKRSCRDVFERMIDNVPPTLTLSEPIEAVNVKPYITTLELSGNGTLNFSGRIRILKTVTTTSSDIQVYLKARDRDDNGTATISTSRNSEVSRGLYGEVFTWFDFTTSIPRISAFNIHVHNPTTNSTTIHNNGGLGYPVSDTLLYLTSSSCVSRASPRTFNINVAVHRSRAGDPVILELVRINRRRGIIVPELSVETLRLEATGVARGKWVVFGASVELASNGWSTSFDLVLRGKDGRDEIRVEFLRTVLCARGS